MYLKNGPSTDFENHDIVLNKRDPQTKKGAFQSTSPSHSFKVKKI